EGLESLIASRTIQRLPDLPVVVISTPPSDMEVGPEVASMIFSGTASGSMLSEVQWSVNGGSWQTASGTTSRTFTVNLQTGQNVVDVRGKNSDGPNGYLDSRMITRLVPTVLLGDINGDGRI